MIPVLLWGLYFLLPFGLGLALDPSPGLLSPYSSGRERDCRSLSDAGARQLRPGEFENDTGRAPFADTSAMLCTSRVVARDDRSAADDAILSSLSLQIPQLTRRVRTLAPDDTEWFVEAEHPSEKVAAKIAVAAKVLLAEDNARVSEEGPLISAQAIQGLHPLPAEKVFPSACAAQAPGLTARQRVLTLFVLAPRETQLHAGLCGQKGWQWVL